MGSGRALTLGLYSEDPVLSWIGSMGLALVAGTALVVDLVGPSHHGERSLSDLSADGPQLRDLSPTRTGVAVISGVDLAPAAVEPVVDILGRSWPALVFRCRPAAYPAATVTYRALYPGVLASNDESPAVWQRLYSWSSPPGPGPVLPRIPALAVHQLLHLRRPIARSWIRSWKPVWEMPWA